jgi:hypothetical protein
MLMQNLGRRASTQNLQGTHVRFSALLSCELDFGELLGVRAGRFQRSFGRHFASLKCYFVSTFRWLLSNQLPLSIFYFKFDMKKYPLT